MTRKQRRKVVLIAILLLVLLLVGSYFAYFRTTRQLTFDFTAPTGEAIPAPEFLYSFGGPEGDSFVRPIGVFVDGETVYVSDTRKRKVWVTNLDGEVQSELTGERMLVPLYIAKNPLTGDIWISDRRTRTINIFKTNGDYVGEFDPNLPESELAGFETGETQWAPVAFDFGDDGSLYVTEILNGHRLLIFDPEGTFVRSVGTVGAVTDATEGQEYFQFPNSVKVKGEEVWIADSNNRRIQIFNLEGEYERIIVTDGLPRGLDFLNPFRSDDSSSTARLVVIDTLAHDGTIWSENNGRIVSFGERGVLDGQFSYPNDASVSDDNRIFIADSANARVQVWGWPQEAIPVPVAEALPYWRWCLAPFLLLPLLLLLRKKRFFTTADFVDVMLAAELAEEMPHRRRKWLVTEEDYERLKPETQGDVDMAELLNPSEYSESDVRSLMDKLEVEHGIAVILSIAQRAHVFCTENEDLRRYAKVLEIDVVNKNEFLDRFTKRSKADADDASRGA